jgi:hypothetical protein
MLGSLQKQLNVCIAGKVRDCVRFESQDLFIFLLEFSMVLANDMLELFEVRLGLIFLLGLRLDVRLDFSRFRLVEIPELFQLTF